jgi:hypothetical protein
MVRKSQTEIKVKVRSVRYLLPIVHADKIPLGGTKLHRPTPPPAIPLRLVAVEIVAFAVISTFPDPVCGEERLVPPMRAAEDPEPGVVPPVVRQVRYALVELERPGRTGVLVHVNGSAGVAPWVVYTIRTRPCSQGLHVPPSVVADGEQDVDPVKRGDEVGCASDVPEDL